MTATLDEKLTASHDLAAYKRLGDRIRKGDLDALLGRWQGGRMVREERGDRGRLPNGRLEQIANALAVSPAELKNWMQFAAEYTTEDDVKAAFKEYGSWSAICARGLGSRGTARGAEAPERSVPVPELMAIADLRPHPHNYRKHPPAQLAQIVRSIQEHGFIRNVVVARDNTILAGHGAVVAAQMAGLEEVTVVRRDIDPNDPKALKLLAGDNEIANLADDDGAALAGILRDLHHIVGLEGTGYDGNQLVGLIVKNTRRSDIKNANEAAMWVGLPEYERQEEPIRLVISFGTEIDRERYVEEHDVFVRKRETRTWSAWWPNRQRARPRDLLWVEHDGRLVVTSLVPLEELDAEMRANLDDLDPAERAYPEELDEEARDYVERCKLDRERRRLESKLERERRQQESNRALSAAKSEGTSDDGETAMLSASTAEDR